MEANEHYIIPIWDRYKFFVCLHWYRIYNLCRFKAALLPPHQKKRQSVDPFLNHDCASLNRLHDLRLARLADRVADNLAKHEITVSESLLIGRDFGVVTDIKTGPNGYLLVVSLSNGAIHEIFRQ